MKAKRIKMFDYEISSSDTINRNYIEIIDFHRYKRKRLLKIFKKLMNGITQKGSVEMKYKLSIINYETGEYDVIFNKTNEEIELFYRELMDKGMIEVNEIIYNYDEVKIEKISV